MVKARKKLTPDQKRAKKKAKKYMWVFMNGNQVRIKRLETMDGVNPDKFIRNNADPIWLHQNEMWEYIEQEEYRSDIFWASEMNSYVYNYCGEWKDSEGNMLFIEPIDDGHVYVTYVRSGENGPLLRPWLDDMPASKMIGSYDQEWGPSLDIELSTQGEGFCLSLDFHFEDGNYDKIAPSIIRKEEDSHLEKFYYLFGALTSYSKQRSNGAKRDRKGFLSPPSHTTRHAGPHRAVTMSVEP